MGLHFTGRRQSSITMGQSLTDGYIPIAQAGSPGELQDVTASISEIGEGRLGRTIVESPIWAPIGPLADLAGAEFIFRQFFEPEGIEIIDVYGEGLTTAVIDWRVSTTFRAGQSSAPMSGVVIATVVILSALTFALLATGWAIKNITVLLFGTEDKPGLTNSVGGLLAIGAVAVLGLTLATKRGSP